MIWVGVFAVVTSFVIVIIDVRTMTCFMTFVALANVIFVITILPIRYVVLLIEPVLAIRAVIAMPPIIIKLIVGHGMLVTFCAAYVAMLSICYEDMFKPIHYSAYRTE